MKTRSQEFFPFEIVVAEDDEGLNNLIYKNLKRHKYACVQAFNGKQTIDAIRNDRSQILLLDYKLSDLTGQEVIKSLREKNGSVPPFIVMTGFGDEKVAVQMMKLGASQYLVKEGDFIKILFEQLKLLIDDIIQRKELEETKQQLETSRQDYQVLFETMAEGAIYQNTKGEIISVNPAAEQILGLTFDQMKGITPTDPRWKAIDENHNELLDIEQYPAMLALKTGKRVENFSYRIFNPQQNNDVWILVNSIPQFRKGESRPFQVFSTFTDITKRKKNEAAIKLNEKRMESLLRIAQKNTTSIQELLDFALSEAIDLTSSRIGYIYFYDEEKRLFSLNTWSKEVMKECTVQEQQTLYRLDDTGCWGEAVRQRRPIIINDYATNSHNQIIKGTPEGHVKLKKFLTVPVIMESKIVAVAGVANKIEDYDESDVRQLSLLMDSVWKISERVTLLNDFRLAKEKAEENEKKLVEAQEISHVGSWEYFIEDDTVIWSKELHNIFERSYELPAPKYSEQPLFYTTESFAKLDAAVKDCIQHEIPYEIELDIITSSGAVRQIISKGNVKKDIKNKIIGAYGTAQDITAQKKLELELIAAKEKAEESDRLKSAFLANISHEIRTPMNGILGFSELLREPNLSGELLNDYIEIIRSSGIRMLETVTNLIDISHIETGQVELKAEDVDLKKEIQNLYSFFEPEARKKNLELKLNLSCNENEVFIKSDRSKLNAIATKLIKNALKYTKKGSIEIGCKRTNSYLEFYVKDTGIGIPDKLHKTIFDRFVQVEQGYKRDYEGAGLGLSISKAYAKMLGGDLSVESEEGKGSVFYLLLPATNEKRQTNMPERNDDTPEPKYSKLPQDLTILIAEDDEVSRLHLGVLFRRIAGKLYFAKTGIEAVNYSRTQKDIDLILIDIKMAVMNGYEAVREIRTFNKPVPIIAQTAYAAERDRRKALEAGCDEYISKPLNKNELLSLIKKVTAEKM